MCKWIPPYAYLFANIRSGHENKKVVMALHLLVIPCLLLTQSLQNMESATKEKWYKTQIRWWRLAWYSTEFLTKSLSCPQDKHSVANRWYDKSAWFYDSKTLPNSFQVFQGKIHAIDLEKPREKALHATDEQVKRRKAMCRLFWRKNLTGPLWL